MEIDEILGESKLAKIPTKSVIYVWGYNQSGQTGRTDEEGNLRIPRQLPMDLFGCPAASGNSQWLDIACGREHTASVASDGSLFTWGTVALLIVFLCCNLNFSFLIVDWRMVLLCLSFDFSFSVCG